MSSSTYQKSIPFKAARDFLIKKGLTPATGIAELKPHQPFVFLLPTSWREYKPHALHPYESAVAIIENPTQFEVKQSRTSDLNGAMDMCGAIAYFALPIDMQPSAPLLLGGEVKRKTVGLITRLCYQGPRDLCYDLFPIDEIRKPQAYNP